MSRLFCSHKGGKLPTAGVGCKGAGRHLATWAKADDVAAEAVRPGLEVVAGDLNSGGYESPWHPGRADCGDPAQGGSRGEALLRGARKSRRDWTVSPSTRPLPLLPSFLKWQLPPCVYSYRDNPVSLCHQAQSSVDGGRLALLGYRKQWEPGPRSTADVFLR